MVREIRDRRVDVVGMVTMVMMVSLETLDGMVEADQVTLGKLGLAPFDRLKIYLGGALVFSYKTGHNTKKIRCFDPCLSLETNSNSIDQKNKSFISNYLLCVSDGFTAPIIIKGEPGSTGYKGAKGEGGARGARGRTGATGQPGGDGNKGGRGRPGREGATGEPGDDGRDGRDGAEGAKGDEGPSGRRGRPGVQGIDLNLDFFK